MLFYPRSHPPTPSLALSLSPAPAQIRKPQSVSVSLRSWPLPSPSPALTLTFQSPDSSLSHHPPLPPPCPDPLSISHTTPLSSLLLRQSYYSSSCCSQSSRSRLRHSTIKMKKKPNIEFGMSSKIHDVESEEEEEQEEQELSSSSDEDESEIERELAEVTFEDLQKAKSNGSLSVYKKPDQEKKGGRANKNRPMEVNCKKPVTRFREVVQVPKKVVRDPRFESLCGNLDVEGFRKRYDFLFENNLPVEKEELKKQLKKSNDLKVIDQLKERISWIDKRLKFESTKQNDAVILAEHKKKEREAAKQGKRPFYLKKSEIRKQRLIEKYNKLKASGKLESFIEKRRRKNAAKDHRYMPYRRSSNI